jgi:SPP1 family predicted phage head-tail adaptor
MGIGDRHHPITVQSFTETRDSVTNEVTRAWTTLRCIFGSAEPRRGREHIVEGQVFQQNTVRFRFDYHDVADVTDVMRLVFEGVTYDITSIMPDHASKYETTIECITSRSTANQ